MGGWGSGGGRGASKTTDFNKVDLVDLKRLGMLRVGRQSNLQWSRNGQPVGNINLQRSELDSIVFNYHVRSRGEDWRPIRETIPMVRMQQNFGGCREWFICLSCRRRCRALYGGELFRCRLCYGATYPSQYEGSLDRLISRAQDMRMKLGGSGCMDEPFPPKPKNMHSRTYHRLEKSDDVAQAHFWRIMDELDGRMAMLGLG